MKIRKATIEDLNGLSVLFKDYLQIDNQARTVEDAKTFLKKRFEQKDCTVFIAIIDGRVVGFVLLFPFFSLGSLEDIWILNTIYIEDEFRQQGVAQSLLSEAVFHSKKTEKKKVLLWTRSENVSSQGLFEKFGFRKADFINYEFFIR